MPTQLAIYTESFFPKNRFKRLIKIVLGRNVRGPKQVERSLLAGLQELEYPYSYNQAALDKTAVTCVLNGVETLAWATDQKEKGNLKKIVAGPNISILPHSDEGVLLNPNIDALITPCLWVQKAYEQDAPELKGKVFVWPAGVTVPPLTESPKTLDFLIYNKQKDNSLAEEITQNLQAQNFRVATITYGSFDQRDYFSILDKSRALIYLGHTESQGLAMFEAWARKVPTLVYGHHDPTGTIASPSPYLTEASGMFFQGVDELKSLAEQFLQTKFTPRNYIEQNFTHKKSAEKYLAIINQLH